MKTVRITAGADDGYAEGFDGYPNEKDVRHFAPGEEVELSNDYADLLVAKGLAKETGAKAPPKAAQKDTDA